MSRDPIDLVLVIALFLIGFGAVCWRWRCLAVMDRQNRMLARILREALGEPQGRHHVPYRQGRKAPPAVQEVQTSQNLEQDATMHLPVHPTHEDPTRVLPVANAAEESQ